MHVKQYGSPLLLAGCTVCSITESVEAILKGDHEIKSTGKHSLLSGNAYYVLQGGSKF